MLSILKPEPRSPEPLDSKFVTTSCSIMFDQGNVSVCVCVRDTYMYISIYIYMIIYRFALSPTSSAAGIGPDPSRHGSCPGLYGVR